MEKIDVELQNVKKDLEKEGITMENLPSTLESMQQMVNELTRQGDGDRAKCKGIKEKLARLFKIHERYLKNLKKKSAIPLNLDIANSEIGKLKAELDSLKKFNVIGPTSTLASLPLDIEKLRNQLANLSGNH